MTCTVWVSTGNIAGHLAAGGGLLYRTGTIGPVVTALSKGELGATTVLSFLVFVSTVLAFATCRTVSRSVFRKFYTPRRLFAIGTTQSVGFWMVFSYFAGIDLGFRVT